MKIAAIYRINKTHSAVCGVIGNPASARAVSSLELCAPNVFFTRDESRGGKEVCVPTREYGLL